MSFDFTKAMRTLCEDVVERTPELAHIVMSRVHVAFAQARKSELHGLLAAVTPLRFDQGSLLAHRDGRVWMCQRLFSGRVEQLYVLQFYLPRFQNLDFREKLITIFHELLHISPRFDGSIRRLPGACHVHGSRQTDFDARAEALVENWLRRQPAESLTDFLRRDFRELAAEHGGVVGSRAKRPKILAVSLASRRGR